MYDWYRPVSYTHLGDSTNASISFKELYRDVSQGSRILIDDGLIEMIVERIDPNHDIVCKVINGGMVASRKGINVPGAKLSMPYMSQKDKDDLAFAVENGFDFIAASFVRTASDVITLSLIHI